MYYFKVLLDIIYFFLFLIIGGIIGGIINLIYSLFDIQVNGTNGGWLVGISILFILLVIYKNKFQFSLLYKGVINKKKLSPFLTKSCLLLSVCLLILAPAF